MKEIQLKMNEMCDLLGLSPQAIRLYEKYEAIHSFKYERNGYRYYYFEDIGPAIQVRSFRKLGLPLADAARLCKASKPEEVTQSLANYQEALKWNIRYQQALLTKCEEMEKAVSWAVSNLHQFKECIRPSMYHLLCEKDGEILKGRAERKLIRTWSDQFPFVHYCPLVEAENLNKESVCKVAFCVFEKDSEFVSPLDSPYVNYYPEAKCIGGVVSVNQNTLDYYSVLEAGLDYLKQNDYELTGDILSMLLAAGIKNGENICDYHYVWYPCCKK